MEISPQGVPRIIGGMFGLEVPDSHSGSEERPRPAFLAGPHVLLASARSAFALLAQALSPANVWLPSYLCGVVLQAFPSGSIRVRFYPVDRHLRVAEDDWLRLVEHGDMVVFLNYFGFSQWEELAAAAAARGAWVVEDACLALLNQHHCQHAHYVIFSPRKFVGVPDGGILQIGHAASLPEASLTPAPSSWWMDCLQASTLRREFDSHGGDRRWFELFQKVEREMPFEPHRMSDLTYRILNRDVDWTAVADSRRANYRTLAVELAELAVFPALAEGVVPAGFPIRVKNRDQLLKLLFSLEIYPPVHWNLTGVIPAEFEESHQLASQEITIPCDQRYGPREMSRVAAAIQSGIRS